MKRPTIIPAAGRISGRLLLVGLMAAPPSRGAEPAVSLEDLPELRSALRPAARGAAEPVAFGDLWGRPGHYRGRLVRVEGVAERRFRQAAVGAFPPLTELWIMDPRGNPTCLVYPTAGDGSELGAAVRFEGTSLGTIRYPAGDGDRLAPLVAGPAPPAVTRPASPLRRLWAIPPSWPLAVGAAALVAAVLAIRHMQRPRAAPARPAKAPEFYRPDELEPPPEPEPPASHDAR